MWGRDVEIVCIAGLLESLPGVSPPRYKILVRPPTVPSSELLAQKIAFEAYNRDLWLSLQKALGESPRTTLPSRALASQRHHRSVGLSCPPSLCSPSTARTHGLSRLRFHRSEPNVGRRYESFRRGVVRLLGRAVMRRRWDTERQGADSRAGTEGLSSNSIVMRLLALEVSLHSGLRRTGW